MSTTLSSDQEIFQHCKAMSLKKMEGIAAKDGDIGTLRTLKKLNVRAKQNRQTLYLFDWPDRMCIVVVPGIFLSDRVETTAEVTAEIYRCAALIPREHFFAMHIFKPSLVEASR